MSLKNSLNTRKVFLVAGKRTPFGKFGGSLMSVSPVDLAVHATKGVLEDCSLEAKLIDHFILGNVVTTTTDTMYGGRHLALKSGAREETPGMNVNRLCGSGIQSILDATRLILLGEAEAVIAAGAENMSNIPHLTYGGRFGTRYGALKTADMLLDALTDQHGGCSMGVTAENLAENYALTRGQCENFSVESHHKAARAWEQGKLQGEVLPFILKRGECSRDEHIRQDISLDKMKNLKPSFKAEGTVTPATASGIVDGAASVLVASEEFCQRQGLSPLAEIVDGTVVGVEPKIMGIGPVPVVRKLLADSQLALEDIDLFEINEAFAAQALACVKELGIEQERLNIWGGAIALGHPLGATGTRISLTLARQLEDTRGNWGIAAACIGGGQGIGLLLRRI